MNAKLSELAKEYAHKLADHCDAVQILATFTEGGETFRCVVGVGNWYARQGLAHEFINEDLAREHAVKLADELKEGE